MKRFLLLFGLLLTHFGYSQTPELDWVSNMYGSGDNVIYSIETTEEGYVYCLVGFQGSLYLPDYPTSDTNGETDFALIKLNRYGDFMWGKKIGGTKSETPVRLKLLSNNNVILVGGFRDTVDFDPSVNSEDIRISNGSDDCFALILDQNGNYVHCKTIGGTQSDMFFGVDEDSGHNIWLSGSFKDSIDLDSQGTGNIIYAPNGSGSFIFKMDAQLSVLELISLHAKDFAAIYDIDISRDGNVHFGAYFDDTLKLNYSDTTFQFGSKGSVDCFYAIMDDGGNYIEHIQIGSSYFEFPNGLTESKDGTYVMQIMYSDSLPLTINNSPQFISGNTFVSIGNDAFRNTAIVKFQDTEVNWCKTINCIYPGYIIPAADPIIDDQNNIYIAAGFKSRSTVNQSGFVDVGIADLYGGLIAKLSPEGVFEGVHTINGGGSMRPFCVYLDKRDLLIAGGMTGSNDFDLTEDTYYPYYGGGVVAKYNLQDPSLFMNELSETETVLYPNPTSEILHLKVQQASNLLIRDLSGRKIKPEYHFDGESYQINTSQLVNGVYTLSFEDEGRRLTQRFVVQH